MRALSVVLIASCALAVGCEQKRTPVVYEVPEGFHGWVTIEYQRTDCPGIPLKDGKRVIAVSADGTACTSSASEVGTALDEFYFVGARRERIPVTGWKEGGRIWGHTIGTDARLGSKAKHLEHFFVGAEQEYASAPPVPGRTPLPTPVVTGVGS